LSEDRLKAVRAAVKKAGIDSSRLVEAKPSGQAADDQPQVKLDLAEPESTK